MAAYNASLVLWVGYVAVKRPTRDGSLSLLQPQRWEQSLTDIHHPLPADSLIPMFEGMVDRALSRTQEPVTSSNRANGAAAGQGAGQVSSLRYPRGSYPLQTVDFLTASAISHRCKSILFGNRKVL